MRHMNYKTIVFMQKSNKKGKKIKYFFDKVFYKHKFALRFVVKNIVCFQNSRKSTL